MFSTNISKQIFLNHKSFETLVQRTMTKGQRIKFFEKNADKFKKLAIMRPPDLKQQNITFPINIPIKFRYIYKPTKNTPKIKAHDFLSFDAMTGNQILLYLEKSTELRPTELANALVELGKRKGADEINWNEHEYIQQSLDVIKSDCSQYPHRSISQLCLALHRLRIEDVQLWNILEKSCSKVLHTMTPTGFACTYIAYFEDFERGTQEFRERLMSMAPLFLNKMNPTLLTKCFQLSVDKGNMQKDSHAFENHFHVLIWRRNIWFGSQNYPVLIKGLVDINYDEHEEFWQEDFLPQIQNMKQNLNSEDTSSLIQSLNYLKSSFKNINVDEQLRFLNTHLVFCDTKQKAIESSKFFNIVLDDMQKFQEKKQKKIERRKLYESQQEAAQ